MPAPSLVWHVSSTSNCPAFVTNPGDDFKCPPANASKAGNCLVLCLTYPNGTAPTSISDPINGAWSTTAVASHDAGAGLLVSSIFIKENISAGVAPVTVSFGTTIEPFQYDYSEWCNIATSGSANGSSHANASAPNLACGSFTPTANNDANGGNLILAYFAMSGDFNGNPTGFSPGGGATLLGGNIAWNGAGVGGQGFPEAQQAFVQTAQAAINPSMTATGDTQHYNCVAVALKAASAGNPAPAIGSGVIWIKRVLHFSNKVMPASWTLQTPVDGNLRVLTSFDSAWTAIADNEGGTWTSIGTAKLMWYSKGRAANNASTTTVSTSGASGSSRFFDIINADANPLDTFAEALSIDTSNQTTLSNAPNITPGAQNELILVSGNNGIGPTTAVTSPSGALFNMVTYTGQQDGSSMDTSDYGANLYNGSDVSLEHWNWTLSSQPGNQANIVAAAFKASPVQSSFSPANFGVIGLASAEW